MNSVVYFHQTRQLHNRDTDTKVKAVSGEQLFIDLRHEITVDMPRENKRNSCEVSQNYYQDDCLTKGLDSRALETIGCTFPTFTLQKSKSCDAKSMNDTQKELLKNFDEFWSNTYTQDCPEPCSSMAFTLGFPVYDAYDDFNQSRVKIYFKSRISERRNVITYDEVTLLAEIGGYMGLFLGISLLHIVEILLTFLLDIIW